MAAKQAVFANVLRCSEMNSSASVDREGPTQIVERKTVSFRAPLFLGSLLDE